MKRETHICKICKEKFEPDPDWGDSEDICPECEEILYRQEQARKFWQGY